ncbi:hypothetical protein Oweho_0239 [Owenweeksia hongkongensis DSM 17368]|uniref:Uncharacterized protein n=1 Tax=Owenweeksia hongkongensis (strain DSM 17368 / CIP 108786 / JCM 12287 / NRRL B-23963 / UST20020801) TaxID=926562 RepID=G8R7F0_OWEHD|nr:hypothetical protein [Owenweeksia hongkongensis]AEV31261.1 hypothetical protein Oweho_0239 [Owenweeksia hongkongensis DSM 17368]
MKKDINFPAVTDVKIAIGKTIDDKGESDWYVYIINNKPIALNTVMIVSNASEEQSGGGRKTSTLRHSIEGLEPNTFAKVERIDPAVFSFYNQFWVSFYIGSELFDKKFTIEPFSEWEIADIEELEMQGKVAD